MALLPLSVNHIRGNSNVAQNAVRATALAGSFSRVRNLLSYSNLFLRLIAVPLLISVLCCQHRKPEELDVDEQWYTLTEIREDDRSGATITLIDAAGVSRSLHVPSNVEVVVDGKIAVGLQLRKGFMVRLSTKYKTVRRIEARTSQSP